jgi:hypothetical protein
MSVPSHENPSGYEIRAERAAEHQAMLQRLTKLQRHLDGVSGPARVHAEIAIETLRARLLGLVR